MRMSTVRQAQDAEAGDEQEEASRQQAGGNDQIRPRDITGHGVLPPFRRPFRRD